MEALPSRVPMQSMRSLWVEAGVRDTGQGRGAAPSVEQLAISAVDHRPQEALEPKVIPIALLDDDYHLVAELLSTPRLLWLAV